MSARRSRGASRALPQESGASRALPEGSGAYPDSESSELNTMLLWVWTGMMIIVFAIAIFKAHAALP
jgi:hypothetical protein